MEKDIKIIQEKMDIIESLCTDDCINKSVVIRPLKQAIENLIARNKEIEEELNRQINAREINEKFIEDKFISKEIILDEIKELDNMKVDGEVFTTAVNFAKKILQELLNKGE